MLEYKETFLQEFSSNPEESAGKLSDNIEEIYRCHLAVSNELGTLYGSYHDISPPLKG